MTRRFRIVVGIWSLCALPACGGTGPIEPVGPMPQGDAVDKVPPEQLYDAGLQYARQGDHIRASEYINSAMKHGFPAKKAVPALIQVYVKASRLRDAIAVAERRITDDPADWRLRLVLATLYLSVREITAARQQANRLIETAPNEPHGHYLLAVIERDELKDNDAALTHFKRYLELAPNGTHAPEARAFIENPTAGAGDNESANAGALVEDTLPATVGGPLPTGPVEIRSVTPVEAP